MLTIPWRTSTTQPAGPILHQVSRLELTRAAAGLLEGGEAATHWAVVERLRPLGVGVQYSDQRVVRHGKSRLQRAVPPASTWR